MCSHVVLACAFVAALVATAIGQGQCPADVDKQVWDTKIKMQTSPGVLGKHETVPVRTFSGPEDSRLPESAKKYYNIGQTPQQAKFWSAF